MNWITTDHVNFARVDAIIAPTALNEMVVDFEKRDCSLFANTYEAESYIL